MRLWMWSKREGGKNATVHRLWSTRLCIPQTFMRKPQVHNSMPLLPPLFPLAMTMSATARRTKPHRQRDHLTLNVVVGREALVVQHSQEETGKTFIKVQSLLFAFFSRRKHIMPTTDVQWERDNVMPQGFHFPRCKWAQTIRTRVKEYVLRRWGGGNTRRVCKENPIFSPGGLEVHAFTGCRSVRETFLENLLTISGPSHADSPSHC